MLLRKEVDDIVGTHEMDVFSELRRRDLSLVSEEMSKEDLLHLILLLNEKVEKLEPLVYGGVPREILIQRYLKDFGVVSATFLGGVLLIALSNLLSMDIFYRAYYSFIGLLLILLSLIHAKR